MTTCRCMYFQILETKYVYFRTSEKNLKSAELLKIDWSDYNDDFTEFVNKIHSLTDDVLITSPNDFKGAHETLLKLTT